MFDHKYISILSECELKQENANNQCGIFTFYIYGGVNFEFIKDLNIKYRRENTRASFSD